MPVSWKVTTDVRLMKHKNGYRTVMVRSQAFVLCRTKWVSKAYFGQVFHSLRRRRSLSRATFCDSGSEYYLGKSHDRCEITETQKWITHSNGSFSKSLFYAEWNEYLAHTLDKYFSSCVVDTTYNGLLIHRYMSATQARITKCVFCKWSVKPGPSVISALRFRVVGSRPCSEEIFSRFSSFPLSTKIDMAKFQLDGD